MLCESLRYESETVVFTHIARSNVITNREVNTLLAQKMAYLEINKRPQTDISASTNAQNAK